MGPTSGVNCVISVNQLMAFNLMSTGNGSYKNNQCHIFHPIRVETVLSP